MRKVAECFEAYIRHEVEKALHGSVILEHQFGLRVDSRPKRPHAPPVSWRHILPLDSCCSLLGLRFPVSFQSNWIKSIGHYLPFCFFFFCLAWPGVGCWRPCCGFLRFFLRLLLRISCSCFFHRGALFRLFYGLLSRAAAFAGRGRRGLDSFSAGSPGFLQPNRSKICGGILLDGADIEIVLKTAHLSSTALLSFDLRACLARAVSSHHQSSVPGTYASACPAKLL